MKAVPFYSIQYKQMRPDVHTRGPARFGSFQLFGSSLSSDVIDSGAVDYAAGGVGGLSIGISILLSPSESIVAG